MREAIQCRLELVSRGFIFVAVEADRASANALNDCENRLAFLAADRIAKNAAEKPDIVTQRQIFVGSLEHIHDHTNSSYGPLSHCGEAFFNSIDSKPTSIPLNLTSDAIEIHDRAPPLNR